VALVLLKLLNFKKMKNKGSDIFTTITNKVVEILETHEKLGYSQNWINIQDGCMPHNPFSKTVYRGINPFILSFEAWFAKYSLNRWFTWHQVHELGGTVIKGSKASEIFFNSAMIFCDGKKISPQDFDGLDYNEKKNCTRKKFLVRYWVFNVAQTQGLGEAFYQCENASTLTEPEREERAEKLIRQTGANIIHTAVNRACFIHGGTKDEIQLPFKNQFRDQTAYYGTVFHELAHWTGHESRLKREQKAKEENLTAYAFEELIAELSTAYILATLGIEMKITNNAAYIQSWLRCLKNDKSFVIKAQSQAVKASEMILNGVKEVEHEPSICK
jgi:antirestriction protein ArdC